jgi:uncharacterized protein YegL
MKKINSTAQFSEAEIGLEGTPDPRCLFPILVDTSGSMTGKPIAEVNAGLQLLKTNLIADSLAASRVELALLSFSDSVTVDVDFCSPDNFNPPTLAASGGTNLGAAVIKCLDILNARTAELRTAGASFYRPWFLLLTDAKSGDDIAEAARLVKEAESKRRLSFFPVGVLGADMEELSKLSLRPPRQLEGMNFIEMFDWFSVNLASVAVSTPGEQVPLTDPTWATA